MNDKIDFAAFGQNTVYVKPIRVADLPDELRAQAGDLDKLFAVHRADGEQLALVAGRKLAFMLARENRMNPVAVH